MYDYRKEVKNDILECIEDNYTTEEIISNLSNREEWQEQLNDELWTADSVTGNGSGSYFFSRYKAEVALCHNLCLLAEALEEFGYTIADLLKRGAEWADVTIRCYLLYECLSDALDALEEKHGVYIPS